MPHYTRTHKSAARLQMHPGQRAYVSVQRTGIPLYVYPDRDIHWPENRVPASTKIFHHLGSMGIQAWLLTIALFARLSPSILLGDAPSPRWTPSQPPLPLHFPANLQPGQPPPPYRRALALVRWTEFEGIDGPPPDTQPTPAREKKPAGRHAKVIGQKSDFTILPTVFRPSQTIQHAVRAGETTTRKEKSWYDDAIFFHL